MKNEKCCRFYCSTDDGPVSVFFTARRKYKRVSSSSHVVAVVVVTVAVVVVVTVAVVVVVTVVVVVAWDKNYTTVQNMQSRVDTTATEKISPLRNVAKWFSTLSS